MTIFPDLIGRISHARNYQAYRNVVWLLVGISFVSMILMVFLNLMDIREGGMLDKPENSEEVQRLKLILD